MDLRRAGILVAAAACVAYAGGARAQGLRASAEPTYSHVETRVTDQAGTTTRDTTDLLTQRYRLSLDRSLTEFLSASAGATLLDERGWSDGDGVDSFATGRATSVFSRLTLGTPVLTAGLGADRREQRGLGAPNSFVTEAYTAFASWRPRELPELDFRFTHVNTFDPDRRVQDTTNDNLVASARYNAPNYDLRYLFSWNRSDDHLRDSLTTSIEQTALGTRTDTLFGGRTTTYLSGTVQSRNVSTERAGDGGLVTRQQLPVQGLSAVETFPSTVNDIALVNNPQLVDGDTTSSPAGDPARSVNVGFGPALAGDTDSRHVGAAFADAVTPVNTIHVWLDARPIPAVAAALAAGVTVYESVDNQRWTPVPILGPPVLSPIENRLEVTMARTQARFLKAVLRPIAAGVTTDAEFRDLFVTEVQFLLVLPAELVPDQQDSLAGAATASIRTVILRNHPDLAHDVTASIARQSDSDLTIWSVVNGLSAAQKITDELAANARFSRQDQDTGTGHDGVSQWSAALTWSPIPTAYGTLTYAGSFNDNATATHSLSALGRADWYPGISTQANAGGSIAYDDDARTTRTFQMSGTTSLTPNAWLTMTVGGQYSRSLTSSPELGDILTQFARVDGSLSFTPAPAFSATGTVARVLLGERPATLASLQLNYFPLRGDLQLAVSYSRTLDTAAEATTEILTPSLRWNIRRGVSLTSSYTLLESDAPAQLLSTRAFVSSLLINL